MGAKGVISIVSIIILLYPLAEAVDSDKDHQQLHLDDRIDWDETLDEDMAELLWLKCGAELGYSMEDFQDLQCCENDKTLDGKERTLKNIIFQDPLVKKTILDCLRDKRLVLSKPKKDELTKKWCLEYLVSFLYKPGYASRRRRLGESVSQGTVIVAVIVTAVVTLCVVCCLFYCYVRNFGLASIQNDERPQVSLSMGKNSASGDSKKSVNSKGKNGNADMDASVSVDSDLQMKVSVDSSMNLPVGRVKSSLKHTLKPRAVRSESSLRPIGKMESSQRSYGVKIESSQQSYGGKTESPVGRTESSPQQPPVKVFSPVSSPAAPLSPATVPSTTTSPAPPSDSPPPPPAGAPPPPPPKPGESTSAPPPPPRRLGASIRPPRRADPADASKAKLKPFFWDKVMAKPDQQMVWDKIKSGSFQFNEEMIESLFGYHAKDKDQDMKNNPTKEPQTHFVQIIDPKKAQNLSILLKALNVTTEEVSAALIEGNELPIEIVQTLLKMAPTSEEELKLRLYSGDHSRLGPAERFLKALVEIPYAFKRLESLLFMCTLQDEEANIKESFETLEAACAELKKSQLFLKLLEAVLKTGNRMNVGTFRGSAKAFKLDTLLKLPDVKGIDGKTTLLHFVVQEIMRGEGIRAVRAANKSKSTIETKDQEASNKLTDEHYCRIGLEVVSRLSSELENVTKAAIIDADGLTSSVSKLSHGLEKARESLNTDMKNLEQQPEEAEGNEFWLILSGFVETAEKEISWMLEQEKRIMEQVKTTADYFHGNCGKDEGLRLFSVVHDFLIILDKVCKEIQDAPIKPPKKKDDPTQKPNDLQPGMEEDDHDQDQDQATSSCSTQPLVPVPTQTEL
ncbi:hypothetical protein R6Q57_016327 [Mikania cordata]